MPRCPRCGAEWATDHRFCPHDGTCLTSIEAGEVFERPLSIGRMPQTNDVLEDKYILGPVIGTGGMGVVFKAMNQRIGRWVAIKVLRPEVVGDETQLARFSEEARLAGSIGHDGIVEIIDLVTPETGPPYIVMELLEGQSLSRYLKKKKVLSPTKALRITLGVLEALDAAHRREIIHRDVKPGNIFLSRKEGRGAVVKLLDFGIARARRNNQRLTTPGKAVGTAVYMPPEQLMAAEVDARSDIYAVAAVLYLMLAGRPPFTGRSWPELARAKLCTTIPPLERFRPSQGLLLEKLLKHGLERDPGDRPQSAMEYHREVAEVLETLTDELSARSSKAPTVNLGNQHRVALLPFQVEPWDHPDGWLGQAVALALYDELSSRPGQRVVNPEQVRAVMTGAGADELHRPAALGHELDAAFVLWGKLRFTDADVRIETVLTDVESGEAIARVPQSGDRGSIFRLLEATLLGLSRTIHLQPRGDSGSFSLHDHDPEAFRDYVEAVREVEEPRRASSTDRVVERLETLHQRFPLHQGVRRNLARALYRQMEPGSVGRLSEGLEKLAECGFSDSWVARARISMRHTDQRFDPMEALVLAQEHRVVLGFDARVLLEEASACENAGNLKEASSVLASILDHDRACVPALLRTVLLELVPGREAAAVERSRERAAFLLRLAKRLAREEREEGERAHTLRRGWGPVPVLWPFEALLASRRGDGDEARSLIGEPNEDDLASVLAAETARALVRGEGSRLRSDPVAALVDRALATVENHWVPELAAAAPEVWCPTLEAWLERAPDRHRLRLILAATLATTGAAERAASEAKIVLDTAENEAIRKVASRMRG